MPSRRTTPYKRNDQIDPNLRILLNAGHRQFKLIEHANEDDPAHPIIFLTVTRSLSSMDLTVLTTAELDAMRKFFNDAFDRAAVVVSSLDAIAAEAAANGNTGFKRLWRPDPLRQDFGS